MICPGENLNGSRRIWQSGKAALYNWPIKEMSLKHEQRRALLKARDLLRDLLHPSTRPKTVKEMRERASSALRHFPLLTEEGKPMWSQDDFEPR